MCSSPAVDAASASLVDSARSPSDAASKASLEFNSLEAAAPRVDGECLTCLICERARAWDCAMSPTSAAWRASDVAVCERTLQKTVSRSETSPCYPYLVVPNKLMHLCHQNNEQGPGLHIGRPLVSNEFLSKTAAKLGGSLTTVYVFLLSIGASSTVMVDSDSSGSARAHRGAGRDHSRRDARRQRELRLPWQK